MRQRRSLGWVLVLCALGSLVPSASVAQDSHYWAEQYGTRATLLGGAVIGSVRDLSAVYYNPGSLALIDDQGFILSARAYRFADFTLEDGAGPGQDLASSSSKPLPTMLAGSIRFDWLGKSRLAYSVLTRQQFNVELSTSRVDRRDILIAPGDEDIANAFTANASLTELWAGLAWGYPLSDRVGVGVTQFLATRDQSLGSQLLAQAATSAGNVSIATRLRTRSYKSYRTLWKVGLGIDLGAIQMGANLTTPSLGLGGSGKVIYNASVAGLDLDDDGNDDSFLASDIQTDIPSAFESSWVVGAGAAYGFGSSRVHVSAEWFASQDPFTPLDADDVVPQTGGQPITNDLTAEFSSVLNWGLGIEHTVSDRVSLYTSYSRDHSSSASEAPTDVVLTEYDINRFGAGGSFVISGNEIMLGVVWAGGSHPFPQVVDIGDLNLPDDILARADEADLQFRQWTVVLGFELGLPVIG